MKHRDIFTGIIEALLILLLSSACTTIFHPVPSPTIFYPVPSPTVFHPLPSPTVPAVQLREVITPENVADLTQLATVADLTQLTTVDGYTEMINSLAFSPDGDTLAVGLQNEKVILYDTDTKVLLAELNPQFGSVWDVAFSPDGKLVAAGGGKCQPCVEGVQIWDVATKNTLLLLNDFEAALLAIAFSPDGKILATGEGSGYGGFGSTKLWEVASGKLLAEFGLKAPPNHRHTVWDVAFNPGGTWLAAVYDNGQVQLWDVEKNSEYKVMSGVAGCGFGVAFSPDGKLLAVSGSVDASSYEPADIHVLDLNTGEPLLQLEVDDQDLNRVAFSPNGQLLASAHYGGIRLWDVESGENLATLLSGPSLAFSPDGTLIATGWDAVALWGVPAHQDGE